jgi:RNA polymerase sigma-70 factor (ECF subfamily)
LKTFEVFYEAEFPNVYRAAFLMTRSRDTAFDATQGAFERAYVRWRRLRKEPWAGGWVMTTALNLCRKLDPPSAELSVDRPVEHPDPGHTRVDVSRSLQALPPRQRDAVALFYLADLPVPQIAGAMGITEGAVKAHLAKARANLRQLLEVRHV